MNMISKIISTVNAGAALLAGIAIFIISALAGVEAIARNIFDYSVKGVPTISIFLMLYAILLGSAYCFQKEGHIRVEIILDRVKVKYRRFLLIIGYLICAGYVAVLGWKGLETTIQAYKFDWLTMTTIQVPEAYVNVVIPLGSLFMLLTLMVKIAERFKNR